MTDKDINEKDILCYAGNEVSGENKIDNLKKKESPKSGVWVLYGFSKELQSWIGLQVGISENMVKEVSKDVERIENPCNEKIENVWYVNQFGESIFEYKRSNSAIDELYKDISKNYDKYIFVVVCYSDDAKEKRRVEKYVATKIKAIYWRNGGSFKKDEKDKIKFDDRNLTYLPDLDADEKLDSRICLIEEYIEKYSGI